MSDYFQEMSWRELGEGETPTFLNLLRMLRVLGIWDIVMEEQLKLAPPASKDAVAALPEIKVAEKDKECPVCLKNFVESDVVILMPCKHYFHKECIMIWLDKTNSCPLCRHELPTDDEDYELFRKEKERSKEREKDLEQLHNAMYS